MRDACERARHEGNVEVSYGETVHGVLGRACALIEGEGALLAELMLRPMMILSMAQTVGIPRDCEVILRELTMLRAPWHSV
eukprot:13759977-Alexandrium_andersonii.AAC.1